MGARRILFVSSNGGGLGHLTRLLAIARRLPDDVEPVFLTMSTGVAAVSGHGYRVDYMPGPTSGPLRGAAWLDYLKHRITLAIRVLQPEALIFDGTYVYGGLVSALRDYPNLFKVWSRRAMWKPIDGRREQQAVKQAAEFDLILEPGELAEELDRGFTTRNRERVYRLPPVVLVPKDELLEREEARDELGISHGATVALLNLGAGNINRIDNVIAAIHDVLRERDDIHLVALRSMIATGTLPELPGRITTLETYPLARVLKAFDFVVAAPGYNSFHELLAHATPTLFIPNEDTELDDQVLRGRWAANHGVGLSVQAADSAGLHDALHQLLDGSVRARLRERCQALSPADGASQAAQLLTAGKPAGTGSEVEVAGPVFAEPEPWVHPITRVKRQFRRARRSVRRWRRETVRAAKRARLRIEQRLNHQPAEMEPERLLVVLPDDYDYARDRDRLLKFGNPASGIVLLAPPSELKTLGKSGYGVEIASDDFAALIDPGPPVSTYALSKLRAIAKAYRCPRTEYLGAGGRESDS